MMCVCSELRSAGVDNIWREIACRADIMEKYNEPGRAYHNFMHISRMFATAKEIGLELTDMQIVAIWLHDVVYGHGSPESERMSADYALGVMREWGSGSLFKSGVMSIIYSTADHVPHEVEWLGREQSRQVIDLDLWDLGTDRFKENGILIREECGHLPDNEYNKGRSEWADKMLARPSVFVSNIVLPGMEEKAVENLKSIKGV